MMWESTLDSLGDEERCSWFGEALQELTRRSKASFAALFASAQKVGCDLVERGYGQTQHEFLPTTISDDQTRDFRSNNFIGWTKATVAVSTGDGNCLFNSLSISLTGTERYATEFRVKTCINLVLHPDSVAPCAVQQRYERTCNKRTESVWASVANECGCQEENFAATRVLVNTETGLPVNGNDESETVVRIIQPFELKVMLKKDALKMANDFSWACYHWVFAAAAALKIDIICFKPKVGFGL